MTSGDDLLKEIIKKSKEPKMSNHYGPWRYDRKNNTLMIDRISFEVDLDRCIDAKSCCDWIGRQCQKKWSTANDIGWLSKALDDYIGLRSFK